MLMFASTAKCQEMTASNDACEERVLACEQVIQAGNKYIKHLNIQLDQKTELATSLEREVALLKQRAIDLQPAFYERPLFVVPVTILVTAATISLLRKASQ